jgi:hypothetical protein
VKRGGGRGGWVVGRASSQILGASFAKSADVAAQLLGQPATGEPYTIVYTNHGIDCICLVYYSENKINRIEQLWHYRRNQVAQSHNGVTTSFGISKTQDTGSRFKMHELPWQ